MSKFSSRLGTGYKRVVGVVEDFVVEATKAMESKRLPRSISTTGQYTAREYLIQICLATQLWRNSLAKFFKVLICDPRQ